MTAIQTATGYRAVPTGRPIRHCIICGSSDHRPVFAYTYQFLVQVRGVSAERLAERNWTEDTTSTIVRCNSCGCNYVRDPYLVDYLVESLDRKDDADAYVEAAKKVRAAYDQYANYEHADHKYWIARTLVWLAARRKRGDIAFLDFGSGSGTTANMVRSLGVAKVVAYDPFYPPTVQTTFDAVNFPGIRCVRHRDDLRALGPFDAASFQSAVEHVLDPRGELAAIFELLAPGGLLYVNNPVMDLDREIGALQAAKRIKKADRISYYHPNHLNYMMPRDFERMIRDIGFRVTTWVPHAPPPLTVATVADAAKGAAKRAVRFAQNALHLPYARYAYLLRKPG